MKKASLAIVCCALLFSCKSRGPVPVPEYLDFSNQYYTENGIDPAGGFGTGPVTSYQPESWEAWVLELFAPLDTALLPATPLQDSIVRHWWFFPNPAVQSQGLFWKQKGPVNFKAVLIDKRKNPLARYSFTSTSDSFQNIYFQYQGFFIPPDSTFRIYFGFSTAEHPFFLMEHADVTIIPH